MRALVADGTGGVELREVDEPRPEPSEALVAVRAVSLNRGEARALATADDGWRPGWDVAGDVVQPAVDGTSPAVHTRVVGLVDGAGWSERVAVPSDALAPLPDALSFVAAAALPVAGLTALVGLEAAGMTDGKRVLVTGASGGVGRLAVQIAHHAGSIVTAVVGSPERGKGLEELGATSVVVGMPESGEFDVILESVGGSSLAAALRLVAERGTILTFGNSSREATTFDVADFYRRSGARLRAFLVFKEVRGIGAGRELARLVDLVASGRLDTQVELEASWHDASDAIEALLGRRVAGKAVLHVD